MQRTPPTRAPSGFYSPAEHRSCSNPNTALEDPRNTFKFQYSGLDTQPQPKMLRDRSQGQQSTGGTKPSSPQSRWEQSVPPIPGSLPGTSNNILKNWLHFVPKVQKVFQPTWKQVQHSWLEVHPLHGHSELGKEQFLGFIFHKIRPPCYNQVLLTLYNQHIPQSYHSRFPKELILVIPPANPEEQEIAPCPRNKTWGKTSQGSCFSQYHLWVKGTWLTVTGIRAFYSI